MKNLLRVIVFSIFIVSLFYTTPLLAKVDKTWCESNYRGTYKSLAACENKEQEAGRWLAANPVQDDIYRDCRAGAGQSLGLLMDCALKKTSIANKRVQSPLNLGNSEVWYAPYLTKHFPSMIRACGKSRFIDDIAVMDRDITKFHFRTSMLYRDLLPILNIKGSVKIAQVPLPFRVEKKKLKRRYNLSIDAFLISPEGRVLNISSAAGGQKIMSSSGGTASFSIKIGRGYNFEKGARVLVVASGSPITSNYPGTDCVLLGAKRLTFKK